MGVKNTESGGEGVQESGERRSSRRTLKERLESIVVLFLSEFLIPFVSLLKKKRLLPEA